MPNGDEKPKEQNTSPESNNLPLSQNDEKEPPLLRKLSSNDEDEDDDFLAKPKIKKSKPVINISIKPLPVIVEKKSDEEKEAKQIEAEEGEKEEEKEVKAEQPEKVTVSCNQFLENFRSLLLFFLLF